MPARHTASKRKVPVGKLAGASWFDIEHYSGMEQWSRADWFRAIACRQFVIFDPLRAAAQHWEAIATDCIRGTGWLREPTSPFSQPWLSARAGRFGQIVEVKDFDDDTVEGLKETVSNPSTRLLLVSLDGAELDLKAAFSNWLASQRWEGKSVPQMMTAAVINRWIKVRALPYVDILLYERELGQRFRPVDIQHALFGGSDKGPGRNPKETLEQATRDCAADLMSREFFNKLGAEFNYKIPE